MPFSAIDVFKQLGGYDAQTIVFDRLPVTDPVPDPVPDPIPTPSTCKYGRAIADTMNVFFMQKLRHRRGRFIYANL
jgi:hypothetical protein